CDLPSYAAFPGAAESPGGEHPVVTARRFGQDLVVELGRARGSHLLARAAGPVERGQPIGAGAAELGQARPAPLRAGRVALHPGKPAEPPERRGSSLAVRELRGDRAIRRDRLGLAVQVFEHLRLTIERLRLLRLGA